MFSTLDKDGSAVPESQEFGESLLVEDRPLIVLKNLAVAIGLVEAIVVQQIYWLFKRKENGKVLSDGKRWIFNTAKQWREDHFPFLSEDQVQRVFKRLEEMFILESCQPEGKMSRRKYYRFNEGMIGRIRSGKIAIPDSAPLRNGSALVRIPITETTSIDYQGLKGSHLSQGVPLIPSREELLERIRIPENIPTEQEVEDFIISKPLDMLRNRGTSAYDTMVRGKWHTWSDTRRRWSRIRDWRAYLEGLERTLVNAQRGRPQYR